MQLRVAEPFVGENARTATQRSRTGVRNAVFLAGLAGLALLVALRWRAPEATIVAPVRGSAADVVYATGVVEPRTWAKVTALVRKRIVEICRCEGKSVTKGEVLARLDDVEERAVLTELQARLDRLNEDANRLKVLFDRSVTSRVTYEDKLTQLREQEAKIAAQKDRLSDLELRAPMDGVVLRRDGEVGEITGTGPSDVLFWIGPPRPVRMVAEVNEEDIAKIKAGQNVLVRHEGFSGTPLGGTVDEITLKGDPASKTFRVYIALPDDTPLMIGMSVEANIVVREVKDALLVPAEAVAGGAVWIVVAGRLQRHPVAIGIKSTRMVQILSGLGPEQSIVAAPPAGAKEGMAVRPIRAPAR